MKKPILLFLATLTLSTAFRIDGEGTIDRDAAQEAFILLNKIRLNPEQYAQELNLDLSQNITRTELIWNDTLAQVAEKKALDMATRNYFAHVDPDGYGINYFMNEAGYRLDPEWVKEKSNNNFESLAAGRKTGESAIKGLVLDATDPALGHRMALLGMNDWNAACTDVGIGFVRSKGSKYSAYTAVVLGRHGW